MVLKNLNLIWKPKDYYEKHWIILDYCLLKRPIKEIEENGEKTAVISGSMSSDVKT